MLARSTIGNVYRWGMGAVGLACVLWQPPAVPQQASAWWGALVLLLFALAGGQVASAASRDSAGGIAVFVAVVAALVFEPHVLASLLLVLGLLEWFRQQLSWQQAVSVLASRLVIGYVGWATFSWLQPAALEGVARASSPGVLGAAALAAMAVLTTAALLEGVEVALGGLHGHRTAGLRRSVGEHLLLLAGFAGLGLLGAIAWWIAPALLVVPGLPLVAMGRLLGVRGLRRFARIDPRTGLPNAAAFLERTEEELTRGLRFGRPASLLLVQVDRFGVVASEHGASARDAVLRRVAELLRGNSRSYDLTARLDGDRFAVLLPETGHDEALLIAERVRAAVEQAQFASAASIAPLRVTASLGLAIHPQHGDSPPRLLEAAEGALAVASRQGGNRTVVVSSESRGATLPATAPSRAGVPAAPAVDGDGRAGLDGGTKPEGGASSEGVPVAVATRAFSPPAWAVPAYVRAVCLVAIAVFAFSLRSLAWEPWPLYLTLLALGLAIQHLPLELYGRGHIVVGAVVLNASAQLLGPTETMVLGLLMGLVPWTPGAPPLRYLYDAASNALVFGILALLVPALVGALRGPTLAQLIALGLVTGAITYALNIGLLVGVMSLSEGANPFAIWRERFEWFVPHALVLGVVAAFMAWAYTRLGLIGVFVFIVPALMMRLVSKQFVDRTKEHVAALREAHGRLSATNQQLSASIEALEHSYAATLTAFTRMLDARDSETEGHSQRVVAHAMAIGRRLGLDPDDLTALETGALLHDIGKIGVADAILLKNGPLTPPEWVEMRRHPEIGHHLTEDIPFLKPASPVVRHHHEWWDGTGYPDGLRGEDIPLVARIFAVADAFDAMVNDRPYKRGMPLAQAVQEIQREAGTHFDPLVVQAFVDLATANGWTAQPEEAEGVAAPRDRADRPARDTARRVR